MNAPPSPNTIAPGSPYSSCSSIGSNGETGKLTPVSKVKAALAAIESDSGEDVIGQPSAAVNRHSDLAAASNNPKDIKPVSPKTAEARRFDPEDTSEEEAIVPRGRLAGSLKSRTAGGQQSASAEEGSEGKNAYARIRKRLFNRLEKTQEAPSGDGRPCSSTTGASLSKATSPISPGPCDAISDSVEKSKRSQCGLDQSPALPPTTQLDETSPVPPTEYPIEGQDIENPQAGNRLLELVAKKKAEREAKNAEEARKRVERSMKEREFEEQPSQDASLSEDTLDDGLAEKHLMQSTRPSRKASKKALEEMNRETQRMNRNMQLAHQAKTKKKISKDSLFARFNFRTSTIPTETMMEHPSSSTIPSSAPQSDGEDARAKDSPPTSEAELEDQPLGKSILRSSTTTQEDSTANSTNHALNLGDGDDLPEMTDLFKQPLRLDKGKAKALDSPSSSSPVNAKKRFGFKQHPVRISLPNVSSKVGSIDLDSESDFEKPVIDSTNISKSKSSKLDAFHRLPAVKLQEGRSLLTLRALARLNSTDDLVRGRKSSTNIADMQMSLKKRARLQALEERKAKIDDLKARGVTVQSAEEREKDQAEVENLLEKARKQAEELQQKEKRAAKQNKVDNAEPDGLDTSDEDDDDYDDGEDGDADVELSGSDDEEDEWPDAHDQKSCSGNTELEGDASDLEHIGEERQLNRFLDVQAEAEYGEADAIESDEDLEQNARKAQLPRHQRNRILIEDDEDDDEIEAPATEINDETEPRLPAIEMPQFPSILGQANCNVQSLGMTQAFAATMAETQNEAAGDADEEQDSMTFFQPPPEPNLPRFSAEDSQPLVQDSQTGRTDDQETAASHRIDLHFSQSQLQPDTIGPIELQRESTELTEIPDPTQDAGFALLSPAPERFVSAPPSTVDTVVIPTHQKEQSPVQKIRGRLVRGRPLAARVEQDETAGDEASPLPRDAFKAMQEIRKKKAHEAAFDKKKSDAKEMVEEQAMESEDEYAGLGGASDDDSGGEEDQDVKAMLDHGDIDVDEGQLAALYANKERASDEKAVEKLFKDINNGGLRRKRGADFDLSDSDDDGEARRRRKQREFAKMRKALLADEKVGQIAEDPKKLAFLKAIEDREDDEGLDFLERSAEDSFRVEMDTQEDGVADSQSQQPSLPATQDASSKKRKRVLEETTPNMRPPPAARRTAAGPMTKKPSTLAEIRESVSFLTEIPGATMDVPDPSSSASEAEADDHTIHHHHHHPRRTASNPIVDRLMLKRASSTAHPISNSSSASGSRLAFFDPTSTTSTSDGFKVPSLLRRATTSNLSAESAVDKNGISTYAPTERAAGGGEDGRRVGFKKGSKKCSVNYFAREMEKKGVVEGVERRRREERERRARERRAGGLSGLVGIGGFD